jgi:hypothetical protein
MFDPTDFVCRLPFPWLSAANASDQLAALGADQLLVAHLVGQTGAELTETVVTFGPRARPGASALAKQAAECGGDNSLVRVSPALAVGLSYSGPAWTSDERKSLLEAAVAKASTA